jgi:glycosyltransferase involved in cell wall biosynthesis
VKIACVVHRFGPDLAGGSEAHCRHVAERLAASHDVTVLTTCAKDHITWRNEYPAGDSTLGPVRVRRFPVVRQRSLHRFHDISEVAFSGSASAGEQEEWFRENGPDSPDLLRHIHEHGRDYDRVVFWAFRYAEVYFGLPAVADRAVLVPTAEDDPVIRMDVTRRLLELPAGYIFLTPEEQELVEQRLSVPLPPSCIAGSGLDPSDPQLQVPLESIGVSRPFALYLGRIDPNKGCETLLQHFVRYAHEHDDGLELVMAGPANMPIVDHPRVKKLGFVDESIRETLLGSASMLVVPSRFESLSLVLLEAWNHGLGAVVNGHCRVLRGQALRANAALYYHNYDEFARVMEYLLEHSGVARQLGQQGRDYVNREYRWPHVMARINDLLERVGRRDARTDA